MKRDGRQFGVWKTRQRSRWKKKGKAKKDRPHNRWKISLRVLYA